jgi:periplasmic protein TonB
MNVTLNTFPPFQSMNSPRGWILAAIVLLHCGFFLALSSGMGSRIITALRPSAVMITPKSEAQPPPPTEKPTLPNIKGIEEVWIPEPVLPLAPSEPESATSLRDPLVATPGTLTQTQTGSAEPITTEPAIDPRTGLSEPLYPASEIRAEHTGTVLLSVYVLTNGRVGEVRLDQTSGYRKLDESALREARRWRFQPGMQDGVPTAMWKQVPITFRLQGAGSRRF